MLWALKWETFRVSQLRALLGYLKQALFKTLMTCEGREEAACGMWKEEPDDHSPGPSPGNVIIGLNNKFVTTWLREMGHDFNISQRSWQQWNLKGEIFFKWLAY